MLVPNRVRHIEAATPGQKVICTTKNVAAAMIKAATTALLRGPKIRSKTR